jgi:hypothetical protein
MPRRWIGQTLETLKLLRRHRPEILFIPNPSLALTVLALLTRRWFGYCLVVDAHNEGVRPFARSGVLVRLVTRHLLKSADVTIVTNPALAHDVSAVGGRPLVLPDRLPVPPAASGTADDSADVAVIATFALDEPIPAIVAAAATLPDVRFAVSGDAARFDALGIDLPPNVRLTGFLPDPAYWELLAGARVICDLTL